MYTCLIECTPMYPYHTSLQTYLSYAAKITVVAKLTPLSSNFHSYTWVQWPGLVHPQTQLWCSLSVTLLWTGNPAESLQSCSNPTFTYSSRCYILACPHSDTMCTTECNSLVPGDLPSTHTWMTPRSSYPVHWQE